MGSMNAVIQWGDYDGGHLWIADESDYQHTLTARERWYLIDARTSKHGVGRVLRGVRWSIILYQPGRLQQVPAPLWRELRNLQFPSCEPSAKRVWHECHGGVWFLTWFGAGCFLDPKSLDAWGYREVAPRDFPQLSHEHEQKYAVLLSWADAMEDEQVKQLSRKERKTIEASGFVVEISDIPKPSDSPVYYDVEHSQGSGQKEDVHGEG
eukprot:5746595-Amphidinium_carterae.1